MAIRKVSSFLSSTNLTFVNNNQLIIDSDQLLKPFEVANQFNLHFSSIGKRIADNNTYQIQESQVALLCSLMIIMFSQRYSQVFSLTAIITITLVILHVIHMNIVHHFLNLLSSSSPVNVISKTISSNSLTKPNQLQPCTFNILYRLFKKLLHTFFNSYSLMCSFVRLLTLWMCLLETC